MKRIKIFLSDPQVLFREGIHFILSGEDDFEVTGEAINNEETLTHIENNPPNLVILNMQDKKVSGPEIVRRIKKRFPSVSAVLTIDKKDGDQLFEAIRSGASAFLTKDADPEHLLDTVRVVSQGSLPIMEELLTPEIAAKALTEFEDINSLNERMDNLMAVLTQKEKQVLTNVAAGNNTEEVAAKMNIDEETVRGTLRLILNKLVTNDQTREVITTVQQSLPAMLGNTGGPPGRPDEYLTREEFTKFKDSLAKRLKNIAGIVT